MQDHCNIMMKNSRVHVHTIHKFFSYILGKSAMYSVACVAVSSFVKTVTHFVTMFFIRTT